MKFTYAFTVSGLWVSSQFLFSKAFGITITEPMYFLMGINFGLIFMMGWRIFKYYEQTKEGKDEIEKNHISKD